MKQISEMVLEAHRIANGFSNLIIEQKISREHGDELNSDLFELYKRYSKHVNIHGQNGLVETSIEVTVKVNDAYLSLCKE